MAYLYSTGLNTAQVNAGINAICDTQDFDQAVCDATRQVLNDVVTVGTAARAHNANRYQVQKLVDQVIRYYARRKVISFTLPQLGNPGSAKLSQKQESVAIYQISKASLDDCYDVIGIPRDKMREHLELIFCGRGNDADVPWTSIAARRLLGQVDARILNRYIAQFNQALRFVERVIRREKTIRDKANKWVPIHERDISEGAEETLRELGLSNTVGNEEERQPAESERHRRPAASVTGIKPVVEQATPQVVDRPAPIDLDNLMDSWD